MKKTTEFVAKRLCLAPKAILTLHKTAKELKALLDSLKQEITDLLQRNEQNPASDSRKAAAFIKKQNTLRDGILCAKEALVTVDRLVATLSMLHLGSDSIQPDAKLGQFFGINGKHICILQFIPPPSEVDPSVEPQ